MSYDNAEPKVLKTLNSSGQVLDDGGNVINDTTSYWEKKYNEAEPKADKILKSDGSIVDSNGNQIQATNEYNVKKYNQAEPIPAKYLHADGTIDENPGGGSAAAEGGFYKWHFTQTGNGEGDLYCSFDKSPENMEDLVSKKSLYYDSGIIKEGNFPKDIYWDNFVRVSDTEFTYTFEGDPETATKVIS